MIDDDDLHVREKFTPPPGGGSAPSGAKTKSGGAPPLGIKLNWHGESSDDPLAPWLVDDMLYEAGVALASGQWGTYKTFIVLDLAAAVMTKTTFAGRMVMKQGGVLFIAAEGQAQLSIRIKGISIGKIASADFDANAAKIDPEKMPIVWTKRSPRLSDPGSIHELRALLTETVKGMNERFNPPLALVIIDALMPAAQFKDADKSTEGRQVMDMLAALGHEFNVLILVVDHFGKDVSTGTRNASTKEDAADSILALLGDRSLEGKVTNPRMALRKVKGSEQGIEFPFDIEKIIVDTKKDGRPVETLIIKWPDNNAPQPPSAKTRKPWPKSLHMFKRALDTVLGERGKKIKPFHDKAEFLAVKLSLVRDEYYKVHPAPVKATKEKAFERAVKDAIAVDMACVREVDAENFEQFIWRLGVE
jgi:hypothetical protein